MEAAAQDGNSSILITGVDPGFVSDLVPFALAGTCQRIEQIRTMEIADYATYDGTEVMSVSWASAIPWTGQACFSYRGFWAPPGEPRSGCWARVWVSIDQITESYELEPAPEDIEVATGVIAKGTVAAMRIEINGMVAGNPVVVVEMSPDCGRICARLGPARATGRFLPRGSSASRPTPSTSARRATGATTTTPRSWPPPGASSTRSRGVAAAPGIRTTLDLPLVTGHGLYRRTDPN